MLLESLTLNDFGLFRGLHVIDLNPSKKYVSTKPIVLFGGLNGSGKTTILTAIRLAIYGKQSLGYGISQKTYDEFLTSKIHRNPHSLVMPNSAHVAIEFLYYKLGKPTRYRVLRSWSVNGKQLKETLFILQDGEAIPEFSQEQCQAFLNELIPLGVSELFFFDGEKIASLADEGGDVALRDAIRKLIGLDIIERLKNDLHIYVRKQNNKTLPGETKSLLEQFEKEYTDIKGLISAEEAEIDEIHPKLTEAKEQLGRLEESLASKGGTWAISRQSLKVQRDKILSDKKVAEDEIRDFLNGIFPLTLAPKMLQDLKEQLRQELSFKNWENIASVVRIRLENLTAVISEYVPNQKKTEAIDKVQSIFSDLISRPRNLKLIKVIHDLDSKDYVHLDNWISELSLQVNSRKNSLRDKLSNLDESLANVSLQIERAPDKESLQADLDAIKIKNRQIMELSTQYNSHLEIARRYTWQAIENVRKMKALEEQQSYAESAGTGTELANQTSYALTDFAIEMTKRKIEKLEQEFANTFSRLARKSDAIISAKIDPTSFDVHLRNKSGRIIPKQDLSAGEKQIYAVAMLEALAKTSGRKLPVIIDTPLGRLDSHHREKLIQSYFPHASHQVIILSTDTEVDQSFYDDLSKHVSHSYHIIYDEIDGASKIKEGYFWKMIDGHGDIASAS
jgi:DNA sulfur modification protein DndD